VHRLDANRVARRRAYGNTPPTVVRPVPLQPSAPYRMNF
jgi:hypothetical protein